MGYQEVLAIISGGTFLTIGLLMAARRSGAWLARSLGLMALLLAGYCFSDVAEELSADPRWKSLEYAFASASASPFLALLAHFLGMHRRLRSILIPAYLYFAVLVGLCLAALWIPRLVEFPGGPGWASLMLVGLLPAVVWFGVHVVRHSQESPPEESARAILLLAAVLFGIGGVFVDLVTIVRGEGPRLAAVGLAVSGLVLALVVVRSGLFAGVKMTALVGSGLVAVLSAVLLVVVTPVSDGTGWLAFVAAGLVATSVVVVVRPLLATVVESRAKQRQYAMMGAFADQLTHDLLNPLASIKGAAQLLLEDRRNGRPASEEYLELIVRKSDALERSVRGFERMGRVELGAYSDIELRAFFENFAKGQRLALGPTVAVVLEVRPLPARVRLDADLWMTALGNLAENAKQAMPDGGQLTLRAAAIRGSLGRQLCLTVSDTGDGMDVRALERIFDSGFSTRPEGRGLGLPFVREVVRAHGGRISVESRLEAGTTFRIEIPAE